MCTSLVLILYMLGFATLGFTGWRVWASYLDRKAKQKANHTPGKDKENHPVSTE